jgi:hypothetical protein
MTGDKRLTRDFAATTFPLAYVVIVARLGMIYELKWLSAVRPQGQQPGLHSAFATSRS